MALYAMQDLGFIQGMARCGFSWRKGLTRYLLATVLGLAAVSDVRAQNDYKRIFDEDNLPPVRELLLSGRYLLVERLCDSALQRGQPSVEWHLMRFEAMAAQGRAKEAFDDAQLLLLTKHGEDLATLIAVRELALRIGETGAAAELLERFNAAALAIPERDRSAADLVAMGRAALALGADPAKVLEQYFVRARKVEEGYVDAFVAAGELALEKSDFGRAGKEFQDGLKFSSGHPTLLFGVARAFYPSDRGRALRALDEVVLRNPTHAGALLLQAEFMIDNEYYEQAGEVLDRVLSFNPMESRAWAYEATLAVLARNDEEAAEVARSRALAEWSENPEIDHLIGRVLSRNYRFAEGAKHQRLALENDPDFIPAKIQLALDLLRLGEVEEAWTHAAEVADADGYNVLAHNLIVLRDEMEDYATIETERFTIRMPRDEAKIYGDRALEILDEAHELLCAKYGLELVEPVLVEFFPHQQDFAIRTFGNLGGGGILGACFGKVVTMNSPGGLAAQRNNWEATLWHEFCHVVTLTVTGNKMPRWLSEGISVYEETQRDPTWGEQMTPRYREMILAEGALAPISELSQSFLNPKDGEHLMFAYFQAGQVVAYLVDGYGEEAFRQILRDLADGVLINDAIAGNTAPMVELEAGFEAWLTGEAKAYGRGIEWNPPGGAEVFSQLGVAPQELAETRIRQEPNAWWARRMITRQLLADERWEEAAGSAQKLIDLFPAAVEGDSGYSMKAAALRALGRHAEEAAVLRELADRSAEAWTAYGRLMELDLEASKWPELETSAARALAINPFSKQVHYCAGCAHEGQDEVPSAVRSFEKLLTLKPVNPSETRFRLARLLREDEPVRARRYLLDALADAPRFRDGHRLLIDMADAGELDPDLFPPAAPAPAAPAAPGANDDPFAPAHSPGVMKPQPDPSVPAP